MARAATGEHDCIQKDNIEELFTRSIPAWVRTVMIAVLGVIFILFGSQWIYSVNTYATKTDMRELKVDLKESRREISRAMQEQNRLLNQVLLEARKNR